MVYLSVSADLSHLQEGMEFIEETLRSHGISGKPLMEALLLSEESMVKLMDHTAEGEEVKIGVRCFLRTATVALSSVGQEFPSDEVGAGDARDYTDDALRNILLHAYSDRFSYAHRGRTNHIRIRVGSRDRMIALSNLVSFGAALLIALILQLCLPAELQSELSRRFLLPLQKIFLNALQLVSAPTIFFSIMSTFSRYSSLSGGKQNSGRFFITYTLTSVFAVIIGALAFLLLTSGMTANAALADMVDHSAAQGISSPLSLLVGMVPDNIIDPFLKNNSLQLLILALLGGVALGKAGQYSVTLTNLASGLEKFFNTCVDIVVGFTPFAVFAVTLMMVLSFSFYALTVTLNILGIVLLGLLAVFLFYLIGLMVFGHISPLPFLRKYLPHMVETFWCGSGITAIPITRRCCEKELGIHPSITAVSIPLGALSNLDGNCVYLTVAGLFLAKLCGVDMLGGDVITVMLMVLILSVGSPITPGSAILAMTLLMGQMGIDLRVISLVLGVNSLVEMFLAACNCAGDVVTSLIVAKRAGKLNTEVYKK